MNYCYSCTRTLTTSQCRFIKSHISLPLLLPLKPRFLYVKAPQLFICQTTPNSILSEAPVLPTVSQTLSTLSPTACSVLRPYFLGACLTHHKASPFLQMHALPVLIAHPRTLSRAAQLLLTLVLAASMSVPHCCSQLLYSPIGATSGKNHLHICFFPAEILGQVSNTEPVRRKEQNIWMKHGPITP